MDYDGGYMYLYIIKLHILKYMHIYIYLYIQRSTCEIVEIRIKTTKLINVIFLGVIVYCSHTRQRNHMEGSRVQGPEPLPPTMCKSAVISKF